MATRRRRKNASRKAAPTMQDELRAYEAWWAAANPLGVVADAGTAYFAGNQRFQMVRVDLDTGGVATSATSLGDRKPLKVGDKVRVLGVGAPNAIVYRLSEYARKNPGFLGTLGLMSGAFVGGLVVERQRGYAQKAETRARGLIASAKKAVASPFEKKPAAQAVKNDLSWSQVESPDDKGYFHIRWMNSVEYIVFERVYSDGSRQVFLEVGPRYERVLAPNGKEDGWKTVAAAKRAAEALAAAQREAEKVTGLRGPKKNPAPRRSNPDMAKLSAQIPEFQRLLDLAPAMYEAVDQSFWDDEYRNGATKMLAEILESEGYKVLGYGGSRVVVQIGKKYAAKVAAYDDGIRQNEDESGLWGILSREAPDLTRLVMPTYDVSGDGLVLLTEVAVPCTSKNKAECSKMVKDARAKLGSHSLTRKLGDVDWDFNWGFHNGVFKLLDYGS